MSLPQKFHNGQLYHYASEEIRCNADKDGAQVFDIWVNIGHSADHFLILSHDEALAEKAAYENHPEWCDECQCVGCECDFEEVTQTSEALPEADTRGQ